MLILQLEMSWGSQRSQIPEVPHPYHISQGSHILGIPNPRDPRSQESHIPEIPNARNLTSQRSQIPGILNPMDPTSQESQMPHPRDSQIPRITNPRDPPSQRFPHPRSHRSHIPQVPHPRDPGDLQGGLSQRGQDSLLSPEGKLIPNYPHRSSRGSTRRRNPRGIFHHPG